MDLFFSQSFVKMSLILTCFIVFSLGQSTVIIDHNDTDITTLSEGEMQLAKDLLHIAYGHTSHGSQLTSGMAGLVEFANNGGKGLDLPHDFFAFNNGGTGGALDLHDNAMAGDCGYYPAWYDNTIAYLGPVTADGRGSHNSDVNVIMWSWCGQVNSTDLENEYLQPMRDLEETYFNVTFVYMTGHLEGLGPNGDVKTANDEIRTWVQNNGGVLYDFADIEKYDPDGNTNYMNYYADDNCDYDSDGTAPRNEDENWAINWQNSHVEGQDWYSCSSAHSQALNANQKAYACWALFSEIAPKYLPNAWFNEIHYDNQGLDINEALEIVVEKPNGYVPSLFNIDLYNGADGEVYANYTLDELTPGIRDGDFQFFSIEHSGIQNGAPDGMALSYNGRLIQFLSYEGIFTATDGIAAGQTSENIGVSEDGSTPNDYSLQLTGNGNSYSEFTWTSPSSATFGSPNNGDQSLPVELASFSACYDDGVVTLEWETASEIDNAGFHIYRSVNTKKAFHKINSQIIKGAGNTTQNQIYQFQDKQVVEGLKYFYKLQDVSFAEKKKFSKIVSIRPKPTNKVKTSQDFCITECYPNPFNPFVNIKFKAPSNCQVKIGIYDLRGVLIRSYSNFEIQPGINHIIWNGQDNLANPVSSGVYIFRLANNNNCDIRKLILMR